MSVKPARAYKSPQRDEQANATRRCIIVAAGELFAKSGFAAVTMQGVARHAGVSLATLYLYFPGKAALVAALADDVVTSPDLSVEQVEHEGDPVEQLRTAAHIIRLVNERSWLVGDILRNAQGTNEGLATTWRLWQEGHLEGVRRGMTSLASHAALRSTLTFDEAVDTIYALAGTDVYRALVRERGWSPEQYERWLFGVACRELLGQPAY
ncbi:MAG: helix-turn-helix transcriptional regulator [Candidatus Dormibacteraeota bacterium]|uniref:Helix-turn-helix transcriptional regulator n=1 Tax=Candidatus Aeolococcus gillhamiae TaxID=3127015 RepID=A0A934K2W4_9BACT|nr:helix-turn-helix transcriptional regulator [Candidatus Dormibacteraeota bacterium]